MKKITGNDLWIVPGKNTVAFLLRYLLCFISLIQHGKIPVVSLLKELIERAFSAVLDIFKVKMLMVGKFRMCTYQCCNTYIGADCSDSFTVSHQI